MPQLSSIRTRLNLFVGVFTIIVIGIAVTSMLSLNVADQEAQALHRKWLAGTAMLGELSDQLAEFRMAEVNRALTSDNDLRAQAELEASEHASTLENLEVEVADLQAEALKAALNSFREAWQAYQTQHAAWLAQGSDTKDVDQAQYGGEAHRLYKLADIAVDRLKDANIAAADASAEVVSHVAHRTTLAATGICIAAIAAAFWITVQLRRRVTCPLETITRALSGLAAGDREIHFPQIDRCDELGELARAFEIFRANAAALEMAHEATRAAEDEALAQARHDSLTGLPNRRVFAADLEAAISRTRRGTASYSVLLIDLDHFKPVNDIFGHPAGDEVLCEVARRLQATIRQTDTAVRLGGDEFAVIAEGTTDPKSNVKTAIRLADRILRRIREPITIGSDVVEIGASIGIALCRSENSDAQSLLHEADVAMYRAKRDGKGVFRFFEPSMDAELRERAALEADLKRAVQSGEIHPYYQPLVDIRKNYICGFEVLARWSHPINGAVAPDVFIPLAEQLGLMSDLTESLLRQACHDAASWRDDIRMSFNISPVQLRDAHLADTILSILAEESFPPRRLEIEITETALFGDIDVAKDTLTRLQNAGVTVALDDFGTGYSTLYYLRALKFDKLKIDRSFVMGMQDSRKSEKIVEAVLGLAKNLHLTTVAEGIENPAVLRQLAGHGCEYGQGYYFGRAMPADDAFAALQTEMAA
ncbi:MAG: EAL domain-containing protein [Alphaproteobacteria bacterium]|nr:EAL domain-containing protein [Alphaproteobacteria bacterium]